MGYILLLAGALLTLFSFLGLTWMSGKDKEFASTILFLLFIVGVLTCLIGLVFILPLKS